MHVVHRYCGYMYLYVRAHGSFADVDLLLVRPGVQVGNGGSSCYLESYGYRVWDVSAS